jgi:pyruvate/oxaloacetate carboxyltransferase
VKKSVANGIDVIRIFDALNDPRNLQTAIKSANKEGAHVQGCISYTLSPVHNNEYYVKYAKTLEEMGANSICIKDMAGLLTPYTCYELVKELKNTLSIPVDIHSHYTAGLASMSLLKGIEAGADIVDTAMSPQPHGYREPRGRPAGHRLRHRPRPQAAERRARILCKAAREVHRQRPDQPQVSGRGRQHPAVSGAGRHVLQHAQAAEGCR